MFLVLILESVSSYMLEPRHGLMITTKTTTNPFAYNNSFSHMRPFSEPLFFERIHREMEPFAVEEEHRKQDLDSFPKLKKKFSEVFFSHTIVRLALFTVACVLFFFIGYQTRKSQESNSYIRLPTTN